MLLLLLRFDELLLIGVAVSSGNSEGFGTSDGDDDDDPLLLG